MGIMRRNHENPIPASTSSTSRVDFLDGRSKFITEGESRVVALFRVLPLLVLVVSLSSRCGVVGTVFRNGVVCDGPAQSDQRSEHDRSEESVTRLTSFN